MQVPLKLMHLPLEIWHTLAAPKRLFESISRGTVLAPTPTPIQPCSGMADDGIFFMPNPAHAMAS